MPSLSKPLVVPQFGKFNAAYNDVVYTADPPSFTVNLFLAGDTAPTLQASIDTATIGTALGFGPPGYFPSPNVCLPIGVDLYVAISAYAGELDPVTGMLNSPCAAILKFTGYFAGNNTTATAKASVFTAAGNAYVGLAYDGVGTLYAATTDAGSAAGSAYAIYAFPLADPGNAVAIYNDSSAGASFGDLAFDRSGNLFAADYANNRVLAFPAATLGVTNSFVAITGAAGPFAVASTDTGLNTPLAVLFAHPEGVAFDSAGNLWIGNNNDERDASNNPLYPLTWLVSLSADLLNNTILPSAVTGGGEAVLRPGQTGLSLYTIPTPAPGYPPQLGGMQIDQITPESLAAGAPQYLYVNDETYNTVRQFDINPASASFLSGLSGSDATALTLNGADGNPVVTNPGNGGIALVRARLLIGDGAGDTAGAEPDISLQLDDANQPIFWESPNIGIGTSVTPPAPPFTSYESLILPVSPNERVYVYVNVQNIGCTPTTGTEYLRVYWASGATTQNWPSSWTEITQAPGTIVQTSAGQPLAPGASAVITIPWPSGALPPTSGGTHYCLLARIETAPVYPFGMTYWENQAAGVANMPGNVINNAAIAQCNIYIGPQSHLRVPPFGRITPITFPIRFGNTGRSTTKTKLGFQLLDAEGIPTNFSGARLVIRAPATLHARLPRENFVHLDADDFHLADPAMGSGYMPLHPGELPMLHIVFSPPEHLHAFALRAMQYDDDRLVGGQTYVSGKVAGL